MDKNRTDFEYTICGSMIVFPECVGTCAAKLNIDDFSSKVPVTLFSAICNLHFAGSPIDKITVLKEAGADYDVAISEVCKYAVYPRDIEYYCEQLLYYSRLGNVQLQAFEISTRQRLEDIAPLMDRLNEMMSVKRAINIVSVGNTATAFAQRMNDKPPEYIKLGVKELDNVLFVEPGDFIVIGGYPSAGKTMLSLQFALAMAQKNRVGFFSLETSPTKLSDRIMCHMAHVPLSNIKRRSLSEEDWKSVAKASEKLRKLNLELIPASGMSVRDIQAISLSRRYDIVFVDYLQLITAKGGNRYEEVTNISKDLHTMAQSQGKTVIALAQLSRPEKGKKQDSKLTPPTMSSFRESGQIEQDADVAMLLWPTNPNNNRSSRALKLAKNKDGERGKIELDFDGAMQTFTPCIPTLSQQLYELREQSVGVGDKQMELTEIDVHIPF